MNLRSDEGCGAGNYCFKCKQFNNDFFNYMPFTEDLITLRFNKSEFLLT